MSTFHKSVMVIAMLLANIVADSSCEESSEENKSHLTANLSSKRLVVEADTFLIRNPSVEHLILDNNNITEIYSKNFYNLKNLTEINLSRNKLSVLKDGAFTHVPNLASLEVSRNQLLTIEFVSYRLNNLKVLNLANNKLSELRTTNFTGLTSLVTLNMSYNQISDIDVDFFNEVINLEYIFMYNNKLEHLKVGTFDKLTKLQDLRLGHNRITNIPSNLFLHNNKLINLNLFFNRIKEIETTAFKGLGSLQMLELTNNNIDKIEVTTLEDCVSLQRVKFAFNNITSIEPDSFRTQSQLETLLLSNNKLAHLDYQTFNGLERLKGLDLGYNLLNAETEFRTFTPLTNLKSLYLSGNRFRNYDLPSLFKHFDSLNLQFTGNPISCTWLESMQNETYFPKLCKKENNTNQDVIVVNGKECSCFVNAVKVSEGNNTKATNCTDLKMKGCIDLDNQETETSSGSTLWICFFIFIVLFVFGAVVIRTLFLRKRVYKSEQRTSSITENKSTDQEYEPAIVYKAGGPKFGPSRPPCPSPLPGYKDKINSESRKDLITFSDSKSNNPYVLLDKEDPEYHIYETILPPREDQ